MWADSGTEVGVAVRQDGSRTSSGQMEKLQEREWQITMAGARVVRVE